VREWETGEEGEGRGKGVGREVREISSVQMFKKNVMIFYLSTSLFSVSVFQ